MSEQTCLQMLSHPIKSTSPHEQRHATVAAGLPIARKQGQHAGQHSFDCAAETAHRQQQTHIHSGTGLLDVLSLAPYGRQCDLHNFKSDLCDFGLQQPARLLLLLLRRRLRTNLVKRE